MSADLTFGCLSWGFVLSVKDEINDPLLNFVTLFLGYENFVKMGSLFYSGCFRLSFFFLEIYILVVSTFPKAFGMRM